jgi:hypothetical protein
MKASWDIPSTVGGALATSNEPTHQAGFLGRSCLWKPPPGRGGPYLLQAYLDLPASSSCVTRTAWRFKKTACANTGPDVGISLKIPSWNYISLRGPRSPGSLGLRIARTYASDDSSDLATARNHGDRAVALHRLHGPG